MNELKAKYVLYPRKNPFQAVTVLHPPGQQLTGWYSANAFFYAVQGKSESSNSRREEIMHDKAEQEVACSTEDAKQPEIHTEVLVSGESAPTIALQSKDTLDLYQPD